MSATSILRQIYACENRIDNLNSKISQLEDDIDDLNNLQSTLDGLHEDFIDEYTGRKDDLKTVSTFKDTVKLAKTYNIGMNELINGPSYYTANNSIVNAQIAVNNKIRQLTSDLEEAEESLNYEYNRINELEWMYDEAIAEEKSYY